MSDFRVYDGIVEILDDALLTHWWDRKDFQDAVVTASGPEGHADKRLLMDFEADLARVVAGKQFGDELDAVLTHYLPEDYRQHDPSIGPGRKGLTEWFRTVAIHFPGTPPPPVALTAQAGLVTAILTLKLPPQAPGGPGQVFLVTLFRVRDGLVVEHWGGGKP